MLEKGEGPSPPLLLRFTHKEPKGVLRLPPPPDSTRRPRDKQASEMLVSTEPCEKKKSLLMSLFFLRGPQTGWRTFGCGAKNNKRGGSCVQEEADRPRNQRWPVKKGKQCIKGGVSRNWSHSVSLNKTIRAEAAGRTHTRAKRLPSVFIQNFMKLIQFTNRLRPLKGKVRRF